MYSMETYQKQPVARLDEGRFLEKERPSNLLGPASGTNRRHRDLQEWHERIVEIRRQYPRLESISD